MTQRMEFSPKVKLQIYRRAGGPDNVRCERCDWPIRGRNFEVDHRAAEWTKDHVPRDEREPLTADDGWLLGNEKECGCHKKKSATESRDRAHGKRIVAKAARAEKKYSRPIPGSRNSKFKKRIDGTVILR